MNLAELPPMREALLSEDQVRQLFSDIEALATDVLLMQRSARAPRATASKATTAEQLRVVQDAILSGTVPRVANSLSLASRQLDRHFGTSR